MSRVSEHIERHAKRALHATRNGARGVSTRIKQTSRAARDHLVKMRGVWWTLGIALGILTMTILLYAWEFDTIEAMDATHPLECGSFLFNANEARCDAMTHTVFSTMELRAVLCDGARERRGTAAAELCAEYEEFLSDTLHGASLQERGISLWMPVDTVKGDVLIAKTKTPASAVHLLCGSIIAEEHTIEGEIIKMTVLDTIDGLCTFIATTTEGSVTSAPFHLTTE